MSLEPFVPSLKPLPTHLCLCLSAQRLLHAQVPLHPGPFPHDGLVSRPPLHLREDAVRMSTALIPFSWRKESFLRGSDLVNIWRSQLCYGLVFPSRTKSTTSGSRAARSRPCPGAGGCGERLLIPGTWPLTQPCLQRAPAKTPSWRCIPLLPLKLLGGS